MTYCIWKYKIPKLGEFTLDIPSGSVPLHVAVQHEEPCMWWRVNAAAPLQTRFFQVVGTGHGFDAGKREYIGTWLDGNFVWHLWEVAR